MMLMKISYSEQYPIKSVIGVKFWKIESGVTGRFTKYFQICLFRNKIWKYRVNKRDSHPRSSLGRSKGPL